MDNNEFMGMLLSFLQDIGNTEVPGDLVKGSSYGVVKRDGVDKLVIVDYGLTDEVYDTHYNKKRSYY